MPTDPWDGFDLLVDRRWKAGGIGRYSREVATRLPAHTSLEGNSHPSGPHSPLELAWLAQRARRTPSTRRPHVLFTPGYQPPLIGARAAVIGIFDLMYLRGGSGTTPTRALYFDQVIRRLARRCGGIVTLTEGIATRIREWLGDGGVEVVATGCGVDDTFFRTPLALDQREQQILYVGSRMPTKNIPGVLGGFARSDARRAGYQLVMTGTLDPVLRAQAHAAGLDGGSLRLVGEPDDEGLAGLYAASAAVLLPSYDEGFGLTAAEAMASGTPVVFGGGALPEVVGDAGIEVDPGDHGSIAQGIDAVIIDPADWARLSEAGARRAATLRWDDVAAKVAQLLVRVAHRS